MNNVTFGNERHQYYETVGSGSGAGDGYHGASVVQTHMTNSRLTDPEVLGGATRCCCASSPYVRAAGAPVAGGAATAPSDASSSPSR